MARRCFACESVGMSQFVALLKSSDCISSRNHCDSGFPAPESSGTKIGDHSYCVQQLASLSLTPHEFTEAPRVVPHFFRTRETQVETGLYGGCSRKGRQTLAAVNSRRKTEAIR